MGLLLCAAVPAGPREHLFSDGFASSDNTRATSEAEVTPTTISDEIPRTAGVLTWGCCGVSKRAFVRAGIATRHGLRIGTTVRDVLAVYGAPRTIRHARGGHRAITFRRYGLHHQFNDMTFVFDAGLHVIAVAQTASGLLTGR